MKKQFFSAFFILFILAFSHAQNTTPKLRLTQLEDLNGDTSIQNTKSNTKQQAPDSLDKAPFEMFDLQSPPSYPGGERALLQFLANNIRYPGLARQKGIQGEVIATFVVDKDGAITTPTVVNDIGGGCGEEVIRVLGVMPAWIPGYIGDTPVKVRFTLPVNFRLENPKVSKKKKFRDRDSIFGN